MSLDAFRALPEPRQRALIDLMEAFEPTRRLAVDCPAITTDSLAWGAILDLARFLPTDLQADLRDLFAHHARERA